MCSLQELIFQVEAENAIALMNGQWLGRFFKKTSHLFIHFLSDRISLKNSFWLNAFELNATALSGTAWTGVDWSGMGWAGMEWGGLEWDGVGWSGMG